jgi:hypothetical protein
LINISIKPKETLATDKLAERVRMWTVEAEYMPKDLWHTMFSDENATHNGGVQAATCHAQMAGRTQTVLE